MVPFKWPLFWEVNFLQYTYSVSSYFCLRENAIFNYLFKTMIIDTHKPTSEIGSYIETFIYFKDFMPDHSKERVIPTGHVFIIFELDGFTRNVFDNDTLEPIKEFTQVWVSGVHKNYITISAHQKSEMFVIQFKPYGAYPFLHCKQHEISDCVLPATAIFGNEILLLREALLNANSIADKYGVAEAWLQDRYVAAKQPPEAFLKVFQKIETQKSVNNLEELFVDYPFTQKHLINQFKKYVGVTPKYYQRLVKFNEILGMIQKKEPITWTQLTYDYGFSDQSHFIKTFKHFSGFSPQEFIFEEFPQDDKNFFPLDREEG